jgi:hypothetical protein
MDYIILPAFCILESSSFIQIWEEFQVFYMKIYVCLWQYLTELFL